jgi:outer membrane protein insertion porin family
MVHINRIEMEGNTKTRDKVIRRELKIAEGDLYSSIRLRKSRERVMKTQYFKEVEFAPSPTEKKDLIDLDVRVEEQQMGKLAFGAGYSNLHGVIGSVELSHGNLFGYGYKVSIRAELGGDVRNFNLSFTNPHVLDTPYSFGLAGYNDTETYDNYSVDVTGGGFTIGREITDTIRGDLGYQFERVRLYDVNTNVYKAGDYIFDNQGTTTTGKAVLTFVRNTLDDPYFPTNGSEISVSGAIAGLGGDNYFYSASAGVSWFHPIVGDLVLNLRGTAGFVRPYTHKEVPINERFYVGGIKTLRGFDFGKAGPVDTDNESIGALNMAVLNAEFLYPLSKAIGLRLAVFYDIGKGWGGGKTSFDNSFLPLRQAVGAGIRWYSPFGPIRVDFGYNLSPRSGRGEKATVWDFSMGTLF